MFQYLYSNYYTKLRRNINMKSVHHYFKVFIFCLTLFLIDVNVNAVSYLTTRVFKISLKAKY